MIDAAVEQGVKFIVLVGSWTVNKPVACEGIAKRFLAPEARLVHYISLIYPLSLSHHVSDPASLFNISSRLNWKKSVD